LSINQGLAAKLCFAARLCNLAAAFVVAPVKGEPNNDDSFFILPDESATFPPSILNPTQKIERRKMK